MSHILGAEPLFGYDPYYGAEVEMEIVIDPRTGQRRHRPKQHNRPLPIAPPGWANLGPATTLDLRQAMQSRRGRAAVNALLQELGKRPVHFQGEEFGGLDNFELGSDGYGADYGAVEEIGAELEVLGAEATQAAVSPGVDLGPILAQLARLEQQLQALSGVGGQLGGKVRVLWGRHQRLVARLRRLSTRMPVDNQSSARSIGIDYRPTAPGSDMEYPCVDSTGASVITATVGTDVTLTFDPPKGTKSQFKSFRYVQITQSNAATIMLFRTAFLNDTSGLFQKINGDGMPALVYSDADVGKRPGLRINPDITPGEDTITITMRPIGVAASTVTFSVLGVMSVLEDSALGYRQKPTGY